MGIFEKIAHEIWARVVVSNKSTIVGWLLAAGVIACNELLLFLAGWQSPYAKYVAIAVGLIGTALKNKQKVYGIAATLLLVFAMPAFAQAEACPAGTCDPATPIADQVAQGPTGPLAFGLGTRFGLELHLNVSVVAGSYDLTHKTWLGQAPVTGLYALTAKKFHDAGIAVGGSLTFDSESKPNGEVNAGLVTPSIALTPLVRLHGAVLYGRRFGPDPANLIRVAPTLSF